jgi:hypothetical protein
MGRNTDLKITNGRKTIFSKDVRLYIDSWSKNSSVFFHNPQGCVVSFFILSFEKCAILKGLKYMTEF